jgi:hypothetical protein
MGIQEGCWWGWGVFFIGVGLWVVVEEVVGGGEGEQGLVRGIQNQTPLVNVLSFQLQY